MTMMPHGQARRLRLRPNWLWRLNPRARRRARENFQFWGLIHNHTWLQYDPPKTRGE